MVPLLCIRERNRALAQAEPESLARRPLAIPSRADSIVATPSPHIIVLRPLISMCSSNVVQDLVNELIVAPHPVLPPDPLLLWTVDGSSCRHRQPSRVTIATERIVKVYVELASCWLFDDKLQCAR